MACARLDHQNIVKVFDFVRDPVLGAAS